MRILYEAKRFWNYRMLPSNSGNESRNITNSLGGPRANPVLYGIGRNTPFKNNIPYGGYCVGRGYGVGGAYGGGGNSYGGGYGNMNQLRTSFGGGMPHGLQQNSMFVGQSQRAIQLPRGIVQP